MKKRVICEKTFVALFHQKINLAFREKTMQLLHDRCGEDDISYGCRLDDQYFIGFFFHKDD